MFPRRTGQNSPRINTDLSQILKKTKTPQKYTHYRVDFSSIHFQEKSYNGIDGIFFSKVMNFLHGILLLHRKYKKSFKVIKATSVPPKKTSIVCAANTIPLSWRAWAAP